MKLFRYKGFKVEVAEEALLLKPFRDVWERIEDKDLALLELGYIYFMADPRSDYMYIVDAEERSRAIIAGEGMPKRWKPTKVVNDAIAFYKTFVPTAALLLEDTRVAVEKLRKLLRNIDLSAVDDKGKPIYTLNTVTATIKQVPLLAKDLDAAEKALSSEMQQQSKMRGNAEKSLMEDSLDI